MRFHTIPWRLAFAVLISGGVLTAWSADLAGYAENYERQLARISQQQAEKSGPVNGAYLQALNEVLNRARAAGDLDAVEAATAEIEQFTRELTTGEIPSKQREMLSLQARYRKERDALERDKAAQVLSLTARYDEVLQRLEKTLVAEGKVEEAREVRAERVKTKNSDMVKTAIAVRAAATSADREARTSASTRAPAKAVLPRPGRNSGSRPLPPPYEAQTKELKRISPPKAATDAQLRTYIRAVLAYSPHQGGVANEIGANEQLTMLVNAGEENLDLILLEAARQDGLVKQMMMARVVASLATEASKDIILDAFKGNVYLAPVVEEKGWIADAAPMLEYHLKNYSLMMGGFSATEVSFFRVCYQCEDPGVRKALAALMSDPKFLSFDGINMNIRIPPPPEVLQARWATVGKKSGSIELALLLLPLGNREALEVVGKYLKSFGARSESSGSWRLALDAVRKVTDVPVSSPGDAGQWILDNQKRLVWDAAAGQFLINQ
jgi:hypothetical protein